MTGESEFNEVFLDDAFVADEDVVGDPGDGWRVMRATLGHERSTSPRQLIVHTMLMEELLAAARSGAVALDPVLRQRLARSYSELRIYRLHLYRILSDVGGRGGSAAALSSLIKLFWSEMAQRMHDVSLALLGPASIAPTDPVAARRQRNALYYRACTIFAGTSEIQRNTLGEAVLGLPREPR
jgi:alkylation response protein AidB-like acyl-CoA dehydrogenase